MSANAKAFLLGVAGRRLRDLHDADAGGRSLRKLDHEQLVAISVSPGDRIYLGTYNRGRLGLLGRVIVVQAVDGSVIAGAPLALCDFNAEVPHEQARALRFVDGLGLRFSREAAYELHPGALLRPRELSGASADALDALVSPAPESEQPYEPVVPKTREAPRQAAAQRERERHWDATGLSSRTRKILERMRVSDLHQLAELTEHELLAQRGVGKGTLNEVTTKLAEHGMTLAASSGLAERRQELARQATRATTPALARARRSVTESRRRYAALYKDEDLIGSLRRLGDDLGRAPSCAEYDRWARSADGSPSSATMVQRFDGWLNALNAAGLSERRSTPRRWTREACEEAVEAIVSETGGWPTADAYRVLSAAREDMPSHATLRNRLGRWSQIGRSALAARGSGSAAEPHVKTHGPEHDPGAKQPRTTPR
jgi:hypothetical protein